MQKLRSLNMASPLAAMTVVLRGTPIVVHELRTRDQHALERLFAMPAPPLIPDPARGSLAPRIQDFNDAGYRLAQTECFHSRIVGRIAIATDFEDAQGRGWFLLTEDAQRRAWIAEARDFVSGLTTTETERILTAIDTVGKASGAGEPDPNA